MDIDPSFIAFSKNNRSKYEGQCIKLSQDSSNMHAQQEWEEWLSFRIGHDKVILV